MDGFSKGFTYTIAIAWVLGELLILASEGVYLPIAVGGGLFLFGFGWLGCLRYSPLVQHLLASVWIGSLAIAGIWFAAGTVLGGMANSVEVILAVFKVAVALIVAVLAVDDILGGFRPARGGHGHGDAHA